MASHRSFPVLILLSSALLVLLCAPLPLADAKKGKLYVFGDSLVDTGNAKYFSFFKNQPLANWLPYGISLLPPKVTGRFSNGKVITDYVAQSLGLPTPPPYFATVVNANNNASFNYTDAFQNGINFAVGGAGAVSATYSPATLGVQLDSLSTAMDQAGMTAADNADAIALISIGGDDLLNFFKTHALTSLFWKGQAQSLVQDLVAQISNAIKTLNNTGIDKVLVLSSGPLGCMPVIRSFAVLVDPTVNTRCYAPANTVATNFNSLLQTALAAARVALPPMDIVYLDIFTALYDSAASLKLPLTLGACCGGGRFNGLVQCGQSLKIGFITIKSSTCKNPNQFLFFDGFHPSQIAVSTVFNALWGGSTKYAFPMNLQTLVAKQAAAGLLG